MPAGAGKHIIFGVAHPAAAASPEVSVSGRESGQRKYQVFISSTFQDLAEERRVVLEVVVDCGHMPIALERNAAEDRTVPAVIERTIQAAQIYVVIHGSRYGAIVAGSNQSFSHLEYEMAVQSGKIVVPFLLDDGDVKIKRGEMQKELDAAETELRKYASNSREYRECDSRAAQLRSELSHEQALWDFREQVKKDRFYQLFSSTGERAFSKYMVYRAVVEAEKLASEKRISGWIREPKDTSLSKTLEAVSRNRFLVDVVGAMAQFDALVPRIIGRPGEKEAAAAFFADVYLQKLIAYKRGSAEEGVSLFFESGSSTAYAAQAVGKRLAGRHSEIRISTNNVLAYMIFWLVHRIDCSLFPWGAPEQRYGAVFGCINDLVDESKRPSFPPSALTAEEEQAIQRLMVDYFSPAHWKGKGKPLLLGALSGLQLTEDPRFARSLGPHVGSMRNKVFKRFMYATGVPMMLFLDSKKIDLEVETDHCHFILEEEPSRGLTWTSMLENHPVAFCVGCSHEAGHLERQVKRFEELQLKVIRAGYSSGDTAFIARNDAFIQQFEEGMEIRV